jgi:uncharacterized membrane protein
MPVEWRNGSPAMPAQGTIAELRLSPHRSLDERGFATFIAATFALLLVPLLAVIGTVAMWVLLPFLMGALCMVWVALRASRAQAKLTETLILTADRISLERREAGGARRSWEADPHWVRVRLHRGGGPVENYVTLKGGGREVEIGAFLSPGERLELHGALVGLLARFAVR